MYNSYSEASKGRQEFYMINTEDIRVNFGDYPIEIFIIYVFLLYIYHIKAQNTMKLSSMNVTDKVTAYLIDGLTQLEMIEALKRDGVKRELSTIEKSSAN